MNAIVVFFSHSSKDRRIVGSLVELLERSGEFASGSIRCTSLTGYALDLGASTPDQLRADLAGCRTVVGVITRNSLKAPWVLFELGAAWGLGHNTVLMLSRAVCNDEIQGPFAQRHFGRLNNRDDLESFADQLVKSTGAKSRPFGQRTAIIEAITGAAKYLGDDPAFDIVASLREFIREGSGKYPEKDFVLVNSLDVFLDITDADRKEAYLAGLRSLIEAGRVMATNTDAGLAITLSPQQAS